MKIKTLAVSATAFLHLKGPTGKPLYEGDDLSRPIGIDLFSPGSSQYAKVEELQSARSVERLRDNDGKVSVVPVAKRREHDVEDLLILTAGFRDIEVDDASGAPLSGAALHEAVYSDPALGWIKEQAGKFCSDWGKFLGNSATS